MSTLKQVIADVPPAAGPTSQILQDLKLAAESLGGQGKTSKPYMERAVTGADLVALGLATEAEVKALAN